MSAASSLLSLTKNLKMSLVNFFPIIVFSVFFILIITFLRNRAMANHGSAASQAVDETAMLLSLKKLFAVVEAYPDLKADTSFLALQKELSNTEDRIAAARRFYNANIREMSQLCETFPTNLIAGAFGFEGGDYFELRDEAERVVLKVAVG